MAAFEPTLDTRRAHALANPVDAGTPLTSYTRVDPQPDGNKLQSILAVDR